MQRTTIMAEEGLLDRLRLQAAERGVSLAVVVREALEEKAARYRPRPRSLGIGASKPRAKPAKEMTGRIPPR